MVSCHAVTAVTANKGQFWDPDCRVGWWGSLGLEVSYNENYCLEGRAERRTGATEGEDGVGEARSIDCVYRHIPLHHALLSCTQRLQTTFVNGVNGVNDYLVVRKLNGRLGTLC